MHRSPSHDHDLLCRLLRALQSQYDLIDCSDLQQLVAIKQLALVFLDSVSRTNTGSDGAFSVDAAMSAIADSETGTHPSALTLTLAGATRQVSEDIVVLQRVQRLLTGSLSAVVDTHEAIDMKALTMSRGTQWSSV